MDVVAGRNPVREALKAGRSITKLLVEKGEKRGSVREIMALAIEQGIVIQEEDRRKLDEVSGGIRHQGVVAYAAERRFVTIEEILAEAKDKNEPPLVVILDELEDPHNVGAIIRSAVAAGAHGVLMPKRRSAGITPAVAKASAGAIEHINIAQIGNISQTIEFLKQQGLWIVGSDMTGKDLYYKVDLAGPVAIVIGSEGKGLGRLVRERCDYVVTIPMKGAVSSLNASVAGSLLLYEAFRKRELS